MSLASVALATSVAKQQAGYLLAGLNFQSVERLTAMAVEKITLLNAFLIAKQDTILHIFSLLLMLFPICFLLSLLILLALINLNSKSSFKSLILDIYNIFSISLMIVLVSTHGLFYNGKYWWDG